MFKLYELTEMYKNIWDLVGNDEADMDMLEMALQQIEDSLEQKAEGMAKIIKSIDGDIASLKEEEQRLAKRKKSLENKQANIKRYIQDQFTLADIDKVKTPLFTIALQNNPPSVKVIDENIIPSIFRIETLNVSIAKKEIMDAIKSGQQVPGAEVQQSKSIRIR